MNMCWYNREYILVYYTYVCASRRVKYVKYILYMGLLVYTCIYVSIIQYIVYNTALKQPHLVVHPRLGAEAARLTQPPLVTQNYHMCIVLQYIYMYSKL